VRFLEDEMKGLKGVKILELGCGTGFVGICVACLGAKVCLTDVDELMPFVKANIEKNQCVVAEGRGSALAKVLKWGETAVEEFRDCELVIASEVIYTKEGVKVFIDTVKELFVGKGKKLKGIISWRDAGRVGIKTFVKFLETHFKEVKIHNRYQNKIRICEFAEPVTIEIKLEEEKLPDAL